MRTGKYKDIETAAFAAVSGAAEAIADWESADRGGYWPEPTCPRWGAMVQAVGLADANCIAYAEALADSPEFSGVVATYGLQAVVDTANGWCLSTPAEVEFKLAEAQIRKDGYRLDKELGIPWSVEELCRRFPDHCVMIGGERNGVSWDDARGITEAGKIAISKVASGMRPVAAMEQALSEHPRQETLEEGRARDKREAENIALLAERAEDLDQIKASFEAIEALENLGGRAIIARSRAFELLAKKRRKLGK